MYLVSPLHFVLHFGKSITFGTVRGGQRPSRKYPHKRKSQRSSFLSALLCVFGAQNTAHYCFIFYSERAKQRILGPIWQLQRCFLVFNNSYYTYICGGELQIRTAVAVMTMIFFGFTPRVFSPANHQLNCILTKCVSSLRERIQYFNLPTKIFRPNTAKLVTIAKLQDKEL